jgi:hypothetical protein
MMILAGNSTDMLPKRPFKKSKRSLEVKQYPVKALGDIRVNKAKAFAAIYS